MERIAADVVVIGAGIAGLCAALSASPRTVHLFTKTPLGTGANSNWAQGGMAAALSEYDSPAMHAEDTLVAGAGLSDEEATEFLTSQSERSVEYLVELGTRFDLTEEGEFALAREAAHRLPRVVHAQRDATGMEFMRALTQAALLAPHIVVHENTHAVQLLTDDHGAVCGCLTERNGVPVRFDSRAVVLASGGSGQFFQFTTNPRESRGEGLVLAAMAGAALTDLEFYQFHPTALRVEADPLPLLTEALRGAGAQLVDDRGHRFMLDFHPEAELAPRDVVARGVWATMAARGHAYLDARQAIGARFPEAFPTVFGLCQANGVDPVHDLIPVCPAAHYQMGGVAVDLEGRSTVPGLWACGEVSSTGVHGANRLASNSLLEAVVFGDLVGRSVRDAEGAPVPDSVRMAPLSNLADPAPREAMRKEMWDRVGLVRQEEGLKKAITTFRGYYEELPIQSWDRGVAWLNWGIAEVALDRRESRGAHCRVDFPSLDPEFKRHSRLIWEEESHAWRNYFDQDLIPADSRI